MTLFICDPHCWTSLLDQDSRLSNKVHIRGSRNKVFEMSLSPRMKGKFYSVLNSD